MKKVAMVRIFLALLLAYSHGSTIPPSWKTCKQTDPKMNDCLKDSITSALAYLIPGNPTFNIRPLEPIHIKNLTFVHDEPDVKMTIFFNDLDIIGFVKTLRIENVTSDWKTMTLEASLPKGAYVNANCRIPEGSTFLGHPISIDARCEFHYGDTTIKWQLKFSEKDVGGLTYYNVEDFMYQLDPDSVTYKFQNANAAESETVSKLLNDNSKVFWRALKKEIYLHMNPVARHSANKIFSAIPKNEITPP